MNSLLQTMDWNHFVYWGIPSILLAFAAAATALLKRRSLALVFMIAALLIFGCYIAGMWVSLERPPMRTIGETRLWYSFFVLVAGIIVYLRWGYSWIFSFSSVLATVFVMMNIFKPEIHSKSMMPALVSPFFVPHVISYMFSYGMLAAALLMGVYLLIKKDSANREKLYVVDNLVYTGLTFLITGLLLGAIWAKQAWGTYWGWDPKETWAAVTFGIYLIYIHHRLFLPREFRTSLIILIFCFLCLQICWYGVNYLPSAAGSIHTYGMGQ